MNAILRTEQLKKRYQSRYAVDGISVSFGNEIVGLLGPNGAGKTTFFYMIAGLIKPDSGHVYLNNQDISQHPMHQRARLGIGYLPQETSIFRKLSVSQNIMAILELQKKLSNNERKERCDTLLEEFNLTAVRDIPGYRLSGGEKRRTEIARALAQNPKFILLDEPFAGIDPISMQNLKQMIIKLKKQNIGILITDHNVRDTLAICDHAYIVHNGTVMANGTPSEILSNTSVRRIYLGHEFNETQELVDASTL